MRSKTRLTKRYFPRQVKVWKNRKEEVLELSKDKLDLIYHTTIFDIKLSNLLTRALAKEAVEEQERINLPF